MSPVAQVLAQELPLTLPWYFGLFLLVVWVGLVVGMVAVARHQLRLRAERRRAADRRATRPIPRGGPPARR